MFGIGKAQDKAIAVDFCDLVDRLRSENNDDALVKSVIQRQLQVIGAKYPDLKQTIEAELRVCQPSFRL